ncbi:MAG: ATP-dependent helicase, partial [Tannerella sp.]|nr:ATP-dependent helicase [Tannerella sp.]
SLYELTESIVRLYENDFPENELVFIQAFIDIVAEQGSKDFTDIAHFLDWWTEEGARKERIKTPDTQNAIRIMSIHKSKGLGFKAVIIPFAEWKLEPRDETLWCKPSRPPFSRMYITPVRYDKDLRNTIFAADYFHEKLLSYIDNLNVMYVAFTRAKEELIVMSPQPKTDNIAVAGLLWKGCFHNGEVDPESGVYSDPENGVYETGADWNPRSADSSSAQISGSELYTEIHTERYYSISPEGRLQLRLHLDENSHNLQI